MNKYIFYCNNCSFKKILSCSSDLENFVLVKSSPIQTKIPHIDSSTGATRENQAINQPKKIKCPKCGFSNRLKQLKEEESNNEASNLDGR